jgi:bifunctional DNA-binding transcriptional regulator/antitoxin component of YhaV-PrlF toxin-antitoxin module
MSEPIFKGVLMSKVNSRRQVTLPIDLCLLAGIEPGDEVSVFVDRKGVISVVKKAVGSSKGFLRDARATNDTSDENSLESVMNSSR